MTHKNAVLVESQNLRVSVDCWEHSLSSVYQVRNRDTVGRNKMGPVLVPPDASSVLNIALSQYTFLGAMCPFSLTPTLFIILSPYFNMEILSTHIYNPFFKLSVWETM